MPARTGRQYLAGLREQEREVWLEGERVKDPTRHPGLRGGARAIASLYDMQCDPKLRDEMTYVSPTTGDRVGLSFIIPRTREDLEKRRAMMLNWARTTCGMMGRSPDFMNVTYAAWAGAADYFAQGMGRPEFAENMRRYYEYIRENDLTLTHSLINLQRSRTVSGVFNLEEGTALQVVRETDAGIVVRGARILATLGPLADEIGVYSPRMGRHTENHSPFAVSFAIPCGTPGLKFLCRESFDLGRSHFDHPLGSRFEEMDCVVFFDDVLVPWERVFLLGDVDLLNRTANVTHSSAHSAHQGAVKNLAKAEFVLGVALLMTQTLGNSQLPNVEERIGELMLYTQLTRACMRAAEADAQLDEWGVMCPDLLDGREPAQPVHDGLSADGRDIAAVGVEQLYADPDRGRYEGAARPGDRAISGDRQFAGEGPGQIVPSGLGHCRHVVRQPPGIVRAVFCQRPVDASPRAGVNLPEERSDGPRPGVSRAR